MGYKAYAEYKDSGVTGLDRVPSHWTTWKVTHGFAKIGSGTTPKSDNANYYDGDIAWVTTSELRERPIFETQIKLTKQALQDYPTLKTYSPHSLIIAMYGATIGRLGILEIDATVNQACCVFSDPEQFDTKFFYYWLWMWRPTLLALSAGGGQPNLSQDTLKQIRAPAPSITEQQKISNFLDHKTSQVDRLIEKKQELIEKLQEQRSTIITTAVTAGLDTQALKGPSGQNWLGDIPDHWAHNQKLNFLSKDDRNSFANGPFGSDLLTTELVNEGVPVIYSGDVKETGFRRKSDKYVTEEKARQLDFCRVDSGDILLAKVGDPPGDACIYPKGQPSGIVTQDVVRIKVDNRAVDSEYLCFLLNSKYGRHLVRLVSVEATRGRFSLADLKSIRHILPPLKEQQEIVLHIHLQLQRCKRLRTLAIREIETLQEYRTALITAAVTGQIDVRDWQVPAACKQSAQDKDVA